MTPERHRRVVELFEQLCDCGSNQQETLLTALCHGDDELRYAVEAMLAADQESNRFLETPPDEFVAGLLMNGQLLPLRGQMFGEYELLERIGRGGMSEVFLAQDTRLGRRAALKFLSQEYELDPAQLCRFEQEARAASALNHPNIVTVYGFGLVNSRRYIATEFVEGTTLRESLADGPLAVHVAVEIAIQTASALAAAHGAGIVHRDVKPENIMLRPDGVVKIVDFGIAKRRRLGGEALAVAARSELQTLPGLLVGTPRYMSPEQARGLPVDARSDLFSLGCVLYEILTASPAIAGTNPSDVLVALLSHMPLPLDKLKPECPASLADIVCRALEKDLGKRYQSADEMLVDLQSARQDILTGSAPPLAAHSRKKGGSRKWQIAALAGIAALVVVATRFALVKHDAAGEMEEVTGISAVTTYPGDESQPSLSPDGQQVAFSWEGENGRNRDIYVTSLSRQYPRRLTSDPAEDAYPAWSPDGKQIAFIRRHAGSQAEIVVIPALGGRERRIRQIRLGAWITGRMLAWSPNAKWLCFTNEVGTSGNHALFLLSMESGTVRQFSPEQDNGVGDSSPAFSPDGRWLAFSRFSFPYASTLLLQRLSPDLKAEGPPLTVQGAGINPKAPVWTKDGRRVLFLEGSRIMRAEIGKPARPFYVSTLPFSDLTLAQSGPRPRLVASLKNHNTEIWTFSLGAKGARASGDPKRIVASTRGENHPRFSPDGQWLAFSSERSGASEVWLADADGNNARQLTHLSAYIAGYPHWSPDGQFLVFHARFPAESQLYTVRISDGVVRKVTFSKPGLTVPSWSLDGKVLYGCAPIKGETQIYSVPTSGGIPKILWKGAEAIEVPNRKLLLYNKEDEWGIYARSLTGDAVKNPERLLAADYRAPWGSLVPFEDGFYYAGYGPDGAPRAFRFYSFDTGKAIDVAPAPYNLSDGLSVTPSRTRLVFSTKPHEGEDLVQLETK